VNDPRLIAQRLGTFNAVNRAPQYTRADNGELLKSLNEAWANIRRCESSLLKKDAEIARLRDKLRSYRGGMIALTSVISGLAWEGLRYLLPIALRYVGR
jgi:hypothetical protein